jgi:hypothetical protein
MKAQYFFETLTHRHGVTSQKTSIHDVFLYGVPVTTRPGSEGARL